MKTKLLLLLSFGLLSLTPNHLAAASVTYYQDGATSGTSIPIFVNGDGIATFLGSATQEITDGFIDTKGYLSNEYTVGLGLKGVDTALFSFYKNSNVDGAPPILDFQLDTYQIAGFVGGGSGIAPRGYLVINPDSGTTWTQVQVSTSPSYLASSTSGVGGVPGAPAPPMPLVAAFGLVLLIKGRKALAKGNKDGESAVLA